ncbi:DUF443 family protein [Staphylococcus aureus]|nr:DUF443 family protein [Staphylococcus aureus]
MVTLCILITLHSQNIILFIASIIITILFFLLNMASIRNKNLHLIFKK